MHVLDFHITLMTEAQIEHVVRYMVLNRDVPANIHFNTTRDEVSMQLARSLLDAISSHNADVTAIATSGVFGTQLVPYIACKHRQISADTVIKIEPTAYVTERSKGNLKRFIDNFPAEHYFTYDRYQEMSRILGESYQRLLAYDTFLLDFLSTHTSIPAEILESYKQGILVTPQQAIEWNIATEIVE